MSLTRAIYCKTIRKKIISSNLVMKVFVVLLFPLLLISKNLLIETKDSTDQNDDDIVDEAPGMDYAKSQSGLCKVLKCKVQSPKKDPFWGFFMKGFKWLVLLIIFSYKSNSKIANVCLLSKPLCPKCSFLKSSYHEKVRMNCYLRSHLNKFLARIFSSNIRFSITTVTLS